MTSQIISRKEYLILSYNILLLIVLDSKVMTYGHPVRVYKSLSIDIHFYQDYFFIELAAKLNVRLRITCVVWCFSKSTKLRTSL